jgi:preprotein translocase subunit SecD
MDLFADKKFLFLVFLLALFLVGFVAYPVHAGMLMIVAVLVFGSFSLMWKEPHIKISGLVLLVILAVANIAYVHNMELKFGIDFSGGTRIPVVLERPVDQNTMNELVQTIKKRISVLGLTEAKVRAIGDSEINVEIPSSDEATVTFIEDTIAKQGVYQGIVDGKVAVSGDHIFSSSIRALGPDELLQMSSMDSQGVRHTPDWGVRFSVDRTGAEQFAAAAKGKTDYPIYMFLDRPQDAVIFYERAEFQKNLLAGYGEKEAIRALEDTLSLEDESIPVYIMEDLPENITPMSNKTKAIISMNASESAKEMLRARNFTIVEYTDNEMMPEFQQSGAGVLAVNKLEAVGLLTAPRLGSGLATGLPNYDYVITGGVTATDPLLKSQEALERVKSIESILKGGALPVQISLGSRTTLPAALGEEFLRLSLLAIAISLVTISLLIGLRYRNLRATMPIVLISLAELTILLSILGSFTIDLAAMAGIIAAIGVGVDAQIVITDELLKKDERKTSEKVELAFGIIRTNATVAIFSMVPLLFSGLVEVIGFSISTILGALLGYMLTRPAYAAIVEKVLAAERRGQKTEASIA